MPLAIALSLVVGCGSEAGAPTSVSSLPLERVAGVALPGASNRFDYVSLDPNTNQLYIAHMNDDHIVVFDVRSRKVVRSILAPGVHGVLAVPALGRVFASATDIRQVLTIEENTGAITARAPAGDYPDGIAWDPVERRAFVSDESGGVETVVSATGRRLATIPIGGEAGNVQYDAGAHRVLADVQSRNDIAVIDPLTNHVARRIPLPGCDHPHGLVVDSARRLAFVACTGNSRLLTLDLRRLEVTGSASIGSGADVLALDRSLHRLYVAAESGEVAVFSEGPHRLVKLGQAKLADNAHTVAVDPRTHLVYFPLERGTAGRPELLIMKPSR